MRIPASIPAILGLILLATPPARTAVAQPKPAEQSLRVFVPPPLEWNRRTFVTNPALVQTPYDLARANGNLTFGMSASQVAAALPGLPSDLDWNNLRTAREYAADVRYFWLPLKDLPAWYNDLQGCTGTESYAAFLFVRRHLFRISFRLIPDAACPSVSDAAAGLFARYVGLSTDLVLSVRYRSTPAEVVDITDPTETSLIPIRWRMSGT
ncbi:hypothetical protein [Rhodopila sp.]|jgi:hypothetical protein|uniref:hypothetical protein n=1 Tax=Rhodopila sp. TaxID=2480087 RepID=UPI002C321592|nr:hypothetical protein [Rhodopila sp.]HVZ10328.1 hypothetical protein [Rhodopila sp.]